MRGTGTAVTPTSHMQAAVSAENLHESAERKFSHASHTYSLYLNSVTVPLSLRTLVLNMAYGSHPSTSASLQSFAASEWTVNDMCILRIASIGLYAPPSTDAPYEEERVQQEASFWANYVPTKRLLPPDTIPQAHEHIASATVKLGTLDVTEGRKGLSRV